MRSEAAPLKASSFGSAAQESTTLTIHFTKSNVAVAALEPKVEQLEHLAENPDTFQSLSFKDIYITFIRKF